MMQSARERKYTVDTNLYIRALRDTRDETALGRFHAAFGPFEYLTSVVVFELRAGSPARDRRRLDHVFAPFERTRRVLAPSYSAWKHAGAILAELVERRGMQWNAGS